MKKGKDMESGNGLRDSLTSDLRGKQSVRATFKLSEKAIEALSVVAVHLGIKQKSLFDHLMEDAQSLNAIAREFRARQFQELRRVQKTFVLSRRTLLLLEEAARNFNAPRDALVEYSIERLESVIAMEREKHRRRKEILKVLTRNWRQSEKILEESRELLGPDDPVCISIENAVNACRNSHRDIADYVEKGKIIEEF
jgi:hypothetical protein